jgi:hypothetical protein
MGPSDRLRDRILPALLSALGVTFLAAGVLTWTAPVDAGPGVGASPTAVTADPTVSPRPTLPPLGTPSTDDPTPTPLVVGPSDDRVATRVRVAALGIDLPVIKPPTPGAYPLCDVAEYIQELGQPGSERATYLYAHARTGMFLPILDASKIENGRGMLGMVVEVFTNDELRFLYEIEEVRRHQTTLDDALAARTEELWLQTSEGPRGTVGKTQVIARFLSVAPAAPGESSPSPKPVVCG